MSEITERLALGVVSAGQLGRALGVSPPTMMRRLRAEGQSIVRIGRGRATRYGLRREISELGSDLPAFRIDASGNPHLVGHLVILAGDETASLPAGTVFDGLPPEVVDMRPSGFMGRAFPRQHTDLPLPPRVTDWSNDHILIALGRRGDDLGGNLVLGDESIQRWFSIRPTEVTRDEYPDLANAATAGDPPGSSAGGERPKFGAYVDGRHVLVKFVAHQGDPVTERWRELLKLESLALEVLGDGGVSAAEAFLIETATHTFLEIARFDRFGERGRRATMTLAAMDHDLSESWGRVAVRLTASGLLSSEDGRRLQLYEAFAQLIANVDRHHYNVALFPEFTHAGETTLAASSHYTLAPAFDQLPMLYAPTSDGQLPDREFEHPTPRADTWNVWERAESLAATFWRRACADASLSPFMREIAARHLEHCASAS